MDTDFPSFPPQSLLLAWSLLCTKSHSIPLPQIPMLKTNPQCDNIWMCSFGRWAYHKDGVAMDGNCHYKRDPRELCHPFCMWAHSEKVAIYEPGSGFSPDTKSSTALFLGFPTVVENLYWLLKWQIKVHTGNFTCVINLRIF